MKTKQAVPVVGAISCFVAILSFHFHSSAATASGAVPVSEPKIGEHFKVIPAADGTNEITLVANGLNWKDADGNWVESRPVVQSFSGGIVCTGASYRVILATNLNSYGSVDLELPANPDTGERGRIISHPLGIGFYDPDSGNSILLARLKDCSPQIVSNKVIYADAFASSNGIEGSITYTYGIGHFHQDITLTTKPSVTPADVGMGGNARLEMLTEIVQSPEPAITERTFSSAVSGSAGASPAVFGASPKTSPGSSAGTSSTINSSLTAPSTAEPVLADQTIAYGTMQLSMGKAFFTGAQTGSPSNALL